MPVTTEDILDALGRVVTRGVKLHALADDLGLKKQEYAALRSILAELADSGRIQILPGGAFALAPQGRSADRRARQGALPWSPDKASVEKASDLRSQASGPETSAQPAAGASAAASDEEKVRPRRKPPTRAMRGEREGRIVADAPRERAAPSAPEARGRRPEVPARKADGPARDADDEAVTGRITVHPAGYGFVNQADGRDVFVPAKYRGGSLDGDQVRVTTWGGVKGTEGRVEGVLSRGRARLTGVLRRRGRAFYLEPDDPRIATDFGQVMLDDAASGTDGQAVVVEITRYPDARWHSRGPTPGQQALEARVLKVLGDPDDPRTEIEKILAIGAMPLEFPADALRQAEATAQSLGTQDLADRIDLRDRRFCTIDPETARDFDDALCIEPGPDGGSRVWVAVADVSHYVRWDDALDREAAMRGVSVYLPDRVISMLPIQLSAGICSLNPDVDRCAMVVRLDYDRDGVLGESSYAAAVIRSHARLDYPGVAAALRGDFRGRREAYRPWTDELTRLDALAQKLRAQRRARGTLDLDLPEAKVILDADDPRLVRDVVRAKGDPDVKQAYQLVEEFMIAANEAVGRFFRRRGAPTVWRVHAPPRRERVEELAEILGGLGIKVDVDAAMTPLGMKEVLDQVGATQMSRALSFLVLRSLKQAVWDTVPIGHFGLASGDYLHFTSPIRRYPDLLVHRLLKFHLHREGLPAGGAYREPPPPVTRLTELAAAASGHERRAMEAEREAVAMYRAYLVRDQIGEIFPGTISAVTSFGAFVELDQPYVEGLIKLDTLGTDIGYDELHLRLRARRSGFSLTMGDPVEVKIVDVSVPRRRIELELVRADERTAPEAHTRSRRSKAGLRPPRSEAALRPARSDASMRPPRSEAALRPARSDAGLRPLRSEATLRPARSDAGLRPPRRTDATRKPVEADIATADDYDSPSTSAPAPKRVDWKPRIGLAKAKAGARKIAKATEGRQDRGRGAPAAKSGRPLLKVSHKGRPKR
jgi:ribonuclease R